MAVDEAARLAALRRFDSVDIARDTALQSITELAARFADVPIAMLSFVDRDCIRFIAPHGIDMDRVDQSPGFCATAIGQSRVYQVQDATKDPATKTHRLVCGSVGLRFYAAAPLHTSDGFNIGTLCVIDRRPRDLTGEQCQVLSRLAVIAIDQLELLHTATRVARLEHEERVLGQQLREANAALCESEASFRDLFDEAPIAYVHEDLDSRFLRANRTARRILGLKPDEAVGTVGKSLVADTAEAQRSVKAALESVGGGTDTSGVVLEMRRKDNHQPVWIQWWSRPAPDGSYTRTMFIDITERVLMERKQARLEAHNSYLQEEIHRTHFDEIVGDTEPMLQIFSDLEQVGPTTATVLILGETGTGKELIARAVHKVSTRAGMPLIKVNCSALPAMLIESELFGHEKGAFTGATCKRAGRFALADGGTIFLDEIGDLPIELQAKLLRVLQEGEFEPLGSSRTSHVDVRVIAATNRNLLEATQNGEFREDLYFRLAVFPISLPPLRDRLEDLPSLACLFIRKYAERLGRDTVAMSAAQLRRLCSHGWPGNVRELQNVIELALITSQDGMLNLDRALPERTASDEQPRCGAAADGIRTVDQMHQLERDNIRLALEKARWRVAGEGGAAELLGMKPTTLSSRMKALKIRRTEHAV